MRRSLPDFDHDAKQRIIQALRRDGPLSRERAAGLVLGSEAAPLAIADAVLNVVLGGDARISRDEDGRLVWAGGSGESGLLAQPFVVLDVETTGGKPPEHRITELGAVKLIQGAIVDEFDVLMNPEREIPLDVVRATGITNEMVAGQPTALQVFPEFARWVGSEPVIVAHNAHFDRSFIDATWVELFGEQTPYTWMCSVQLTRKLYPHFKSRSLGPLCREMGIEYETLHRAGNDARATGKVFLRVLDDLAARGVTELEGVWDLVRPVPAKGERAGRRRIAGSGY